MYIDRNQARYFENQIWAPSSHEIKIIREKKLGHYYYTTTVDTMSENNNANKENDNFVDAVMNVLNE